MAEISTPSSGKSLIKSVGANGALFIGSLFVGFLLVEVSLRLFAPVHSSIYQPDDVVLHKHVPMGRKVFVDHPENSPRGISVKINSLGFRDREFTPQPAGKRMLVYGDSYIAAEFSPAESTFVRFLDDKLPDWEVLNAGVVGYGPDQILLRLEKEIPLFTPDLIVVALFSGNDYGDLVRNKIFRPGPDGTPLRNDYVLSRALRDDMRRAAFPQGLSRLQLWRHYMRSRERNYLDDESIRNYLHDILQRASAAADAQFDDFVVNANDTVYNLFSDNYDADLAFRPRARSSLFKVELMDQVLGEIARLADNHRLPLLVLVIPAPTDICPTYDISVDKNTYPEYEPARLTSVLTGLSLRHRIPTLNLFEAWSGEDACPYYFRYGNNHWNADGQEKAAERFADFLQGHGLWGNVAK